jgi:prephenate dehydrogenase
MNAFDRDVADLGQAVEGADLIFLAVPYDLTQEVLEIIGPAVKPGAVIMDTSPLKLPSIAWAAGSLRRDEEGSPQAYLVGVTPVINPEYLGDPSDDPDTARADLFKEGLMVVSPVADCPPEAVRLISDLSELMGIKLHFVDPAEHDGIVAGMDGLPLLLQLALFQSLKRAGSWDDARQLSNTPFFLATYRLAEGEPEALANLIHLNRENTVRRLDALIETLADLRNVLLNPDQETLAEHFDEAMKAYVEWQAARLTNRWRAEPSASGEPIRGFSLLGGLFPSLTGKKKTKK